MPWCPHADVEDHHHEASPILVSRCPTADVGGVACPVTAAGALPGDCDGDVDAEHACEECGGQLGGELEQCGGAGLPGMEPELAESFGEQPRSMRPFEARVMHLTGSAGKSCRLGGVSNRSARRIAEPLSAGDLRFLARLMQFPAVVDRWA